MLPDVQRKYWINLTVCAHNISIRKGYEVSDKDAQSEG
jgi:hypothetical protein